MRPREAFFRKLQPRVGVDDFVIVERFIAGRNAAEERKRGRNRFAAHPSNKGKRKVRMFTELRETPSVPPPMMELFPGTAAYPILLMTFECLPRISEAKLL